MKSFSLANESEVNGLPGDMARYYQNPCVINQVRSLLAFWFDLENVQELPGIFL